MYKSQVLLITEGVYHDIAKEYKIGNTSLMVAKLITGNTKLNNRW